jgi:hypothetical protein
MFLGYVNIHKGFKCLDVSSGRVYISRDVTFDESIFPFSTLHSNAGACLRSDISLLPPNLLNPTYDQGGEFMGDHMFNSNPSNPIFVEENTTNDTRVDGGNGGTIEENTATNNIEVDGGNEGTAAILLGIVHVAPDAAGDSSGSVQVSSESPAGQPELHPANNATPRSSEEPEAMIRPRTRLQGGIRKPKQYTDGTIRYGCLTTFGEPQNLDEALENRN